ncbi:MAG: ABC transporter permease [Deltaproteobacteria bacterium]|nr:ABC transporter permease [Deltaproteobacteria bacterium]MBW2414065.1 ABC transporter permease [Deltaproteobacteria bacterium]
MLLRIAVRNVARGWRRSLIVLLSIGVGLSGCLFVVAWSKGLVHQMADNAVKIQLAHMAVQAPGYRDNPDVRYNLPDYDAIAKTARSQAGVHASPRLRGEGLVQTARKSVLAVMIGVRPGDEAEVSVVPSSIVEGSFLRTGSGARRLPPVVIGVKMAGEMRAEIGDKLVLHVPGDAGLGAFRVSGLYRTASSEFDGVAVFLRLRDAQRLFGVGDAATEVAIVLDDEKTVDAVQARLQEALGSGVEVLTWRERARRLASMLDLMGDLSWIFYATVFVAMAFGIANTMLMAVYERLREFGVMRSLGLSRARLMMLIALESAALTLAGTGIGLGTGFALVGWLGKRGIDLSMFSDALESYGIGTRVFLHAGWEDALTPLALALVTGVVAAVWPGVRAIRMRPAEALRRA